MKTIDFSYFIERYNAGEMNEAEKTWFQKELSGNLKLREEVDLRRKTDMVLKNRDVIQLRTKLAEIEKKRAAAMPVKNNRKNITLRYAAVITGLIILGSLALFNGRNMTADDIFNRYYKPYDIASVSRSLNVASNSDYSTAIEYYNVHDYRNAALYFSKVLSSDSRYMESTMLYGIANFEEKNYPVAKQSFRKVIDNNDNLFLEDAQWYLALCYLKTDEKAKAVDQLTLINNSGSLYSNNARKILRKLK